MIKRILIERVYKQLTESLDFKNIKPYDYSDKGLRKERNTPDYHYFKFYVDELETHVDVRLFYLPFKAKNMFHPLLHKEESFTNNKMVSLDYMIKGEDGQFKKSDYKTLIRILKTIIDIVNSKHEEEDFHAIAFGAEEKTENSKQKIIIYRTLAKYKPDGWNDTLREYGNKEIVILYDYNKF